MYVVVPTVRMVVDVETPPDRFPLLKVTWYCTLYVAVTVASELGVVYVWLAAPLSLQLVKAFLTPVPVETLEAATKV